MPADSYHYKNTTTGNFHIISIWMYGSVSTNQNDTESNQCQYMSEGSYQYQCRYLPEDLYQYSSWHWGKYRFCSTLVIFSPNSQRVIVCRAIGPSSVRHIEAERHRPAPPAFFAKKLN